MNHSNHSERESDDADDAHSPHAGHEKEAEASHPHDHHTMNADSAESESREHGKGNGNGARSGHSGGHHAHHAHMVADFRRRFWVSLALTIPILVLSPMIQDWLGLTEALQFPGDLWALFALSSVVFFYGGKPFLAGIYKELKGGEPGMMTLIAIAITTAYAYSSAVVFGVSGKTFFWELATLIDVMLVGHWIEMRSVMGASKALEELARLMPSEAHKLREDGSVVDVPLDELSEGDRVIVKPGEKIPADGTVVDGASAVNESMLTGESVPVKKEKGDEVIGGSINGEGSITVSVERMGAESFLSQVVELVRQAQSSRSRAQDLANRAAKWLTFIALGSGAATMLGWLLFTDAEFVFALERTVTVMVITCPHALGLAVPLVVAVSTSLAAGNGLLIRDRRAFEAARNLTAVIFDKTGTITEGRFGVTDVLVFGDDMDKGRLVELAAAVESFSEHPIAAGIVREVEKPVSASDFNSIPGKGVEANVENHHVVVASPGYLKEHGHEVPDGRANDLEGEGKTVVFVLIDGELRGAIALGDVVRPESKEAVAKLKEMGIKTIMLTGDNRKVAEAVAAEVGIDEVFAEVLPDQKADKVKEVQQRGLVVAMTGDGVNDAPALATADVGIAIGAGTDVAVETADIILVRSNPLDVSTIIELSRATYAKMVQNLWWAAGYNIIAIPVAAGVLLPIGIIFGPAVGAALMSLSTVIVAVNARFLRTSRVERQTSDPTA
ncbi:MAG TPA: copper-translocating P-type ATPase [Rhodothermales bacterium]|nr:copper-translocating P-type ATPase [Rhodothermales bacterium]